MVKAIVFLVVLLLLPGALAASASISQSGADSGTVMKNSAFALTVSGLTGSGTATISLPSGFTTSEDTTKSFSSTSLSWTTIRASEKLTGQTISVLITAAGSPSTATTSSFNVVLPPSLSATATPASQSVADDESFTVSVSVPNAGETAAQNVIASISLPTGFTTGDSTSQTIGTISAGSSAGVSWTVTADDPSSSQTVSVSITSSNANSKSDSLAVTCSTCGGNNNNNNNNGNGNGGGGSGGGSSTTNNTNTTNATQHIPPGIGLRNNAKLLTAIEKVMAKGKLSDQAMQNLLGLAAAIADDVSITRGFEHRDNKTHINAVIKYNGKQIVHGFLLHDVVPKEFAAHASDITITTDAEVEIVEEDPEFLFSFDEMVEGGSYVISYEIDSIVDETVVDSFAASFYVDSVEDVVPEADIPETMVPYEESEKKGLSDWVDLIIGLFAAALMIFIVFHYKHRHEHKKHKKH